MSTMPPRPNALAASLSPMRCIPSKLNYAQPAHLAGVRVLMGAVQADIGCYGQAVRTYLLYQRGGRRDRDASDNGWSEVPRE